MRKGHVLRSWDRPCDQRAWPLIIPGILLFPVGISGRFRAFFFFARSRAPSRRETFLGAQVGDFRQIKNLELECQNQANVIFEGSHFWGFRRDDGCPYCFSAFFFGALLRPRPRQPHSSNPAPRLLFPCSHPPPSPLPLPTPYPSARPAAATPAAPPPQPPFTHSISEFSASPIHSAQPPCRPRRLTSPQPPTRHPALNPPTPSPSLDVIERTVRHKRWPMKVPIVFLKRFLLGACCKAESSTPHAGAAEAQLDRMLREQALVTSTCVFMVRRAKLCGLCVLVCVWACVYARMCVRV